MESLSLNIGSFGFLMRRLLIVLSVLFEARVLVIAF